MAKETREKIHAFTIIFFLSKTSFTGIAVHGRFAQPIKEKMCTLLINSWEMKSKQRKGLATLQHSTSTASNKKRLFQSQTIDF